MLTPDELGDVIETAQRTVFRLEMLEVYEVATDGSDYHRYLAGEPGPDMQARQPWLDYLRNEAASGRRRHRVHVIDTSDGLGDYLRYECEWGYRGLRAAWAREAATSRASAVLAW